MRDRVDRLSRRELLRATAGGAALLAGCARRSPDPGTDTPTRDTGTDTATPTPGTARPPFREGFEDGFGAWTAGAAIGPEVALAEFDWSVGVSDAQAAAGRRSLRVTNEGDHDDGTTWATRAVAVEPGRAYTATVAAQFWSPSESFNSIRDAVVRLAPEPPESEADFPPPGTSTTGAGQRPAGGLREPLWQAAGWRAYRFEWETPVLDTDRLWVAVGTSVVWETEATHYVDSVSVALDPLA
jgi:hypothetical protein